MTDVALGQGKEFDLVRRMRARWGDLAVGLGDDAAVLEPPRGEQLVASTDTALDGVHFRRDWLTPEEIGYRAVTAALSDLAAMGAEPLGILIAIGMPSLPETDIDALADGIGAAARAARTVIRGGNIAEASQVAITTTVLGAVHAPLRRSAARPGDGVFVTGRLGAPAAAVRAFMELRAPAAPLRARFAHPAARIQEARWLAVRGVTAAIDISDGLGGDASHLAAASACTIEIDLDRVPAAGEAPDDVGGGEEYELLVTSPRALDADAFARAFGIPLTRIGEVLDGPGEARFTRGSRRVASPRGYDHLSR